MGYVFAAVSVAGMIMNLIGNVKAGNAAKKAGAQQREVAESQAALADYNAAVADLQSQDALARGVEDEQRFRSRVRGTIGSQRVEFAAGGIDVGFGSAADVQADAAFLGELDALTIRTNAGREAWGYQVQAEDLRRRGQIARKEGIYLEAAGRQAQTTSRYQAAGSLLNTTGELAARYGFGRNK